MLVHIRCQQRESSDVRVVSPTHTFSTAHQNFVNEEKLMRAIKRALSQVNLLARDRLGADLAQKVVFLAANSGPMQP